MGFSHYFVQRRDGRIEVKLAAEPRAFLASVVDYLIAAENDAVHPWHGALHAPINPARDNDDPLRSFERQKATATNAELMRLTIDEQFLSKDEAFAWLMTMQLGVRARAHEASIFTEEQWREADDETRLTIQALQELIGELVAALE